MCGCDRWYYCVCTVHLWERRATFGLDGYCIHKRALLRARRSGKTHIARNQTLGHELHHQLSVR
jgi:hypothetical protein